jgi:DNA-binding NarL/FixJ family response regulator
MELRMPKTKTARKEADPEPETASTPVPVAASEARDCRATEPAARPQRVVLYHSHFASVGGLRDALTSDGVEVRVVSAFQEVAAWLMLYWDSAVLVLHPPAIDTFRRATLEAIRKVAPEVPIVALVPGLSAEIKGDLDRARVACVLTTDAAPAELLSAVRRAGAQRQTKSLPHTDGGEE